MNKVILLGRLVKDPEIKYTTGSNPTCVARFTLAIDRRFKREGEETTDFINHVAFGKQGEFCEKYLKKGMMTSICGRVQVRAYEKDGTKHWVTEVVAEEINFAESKAVYEARMGKQSPTSTSNDTPQSFDDISNGIIAGGDDGDLPF